MANSHAKVAAAAIVAELSRLAGEPGADAHQHLLQLRRRPARRCTWRACTRTSPAERTFMAVPGSGGLSAAASEHRRPLRLELGAQHLGRLLGCGDAARCHNGRMSPQAPTPLAAASGCRFRCWRPSAAASRPRPRIAAIAARPAPGRAGAFLPGAAPARSGRGAAPPAGQARPAARRAMRCCAPRWRWPGAKRTRRIPPSRWSTRPSRPPSARRRRARSRPSSMPACAASCASATRSWPRPTASRSARWNHPRWWIARLQQDWPHALGGHPGREQPPRADDAARERAPHLARAAARPAAPAAHIASRAGRRRTALILDRPRPVQAMPGFAEGLVSVQDAGAQLAAPNCCVPGLPAARARARRLRRARRQDGAHAASSRPTAQVLALDVDAARCERIHENLQRLGLQAEVRAADAGEPRLLVGRPAVRRHPARRAVHAPPASCAATRTCAGCAAKATSRSWRDQQARLLDCAVAAAEAGRAAGLLHLLGVSRRRRGARSQAFLAHNNDGRFAARARPFMAPPCGGTGSPSRTIHRVTTTASSTRCCKRVHWMPGPPG